MKVFSLALVTIAMLVPRMAQSTDLPAALVDFVRACVTPRLEGRAPDQSLLEARFQRESETSSDQESGVTRYVAKDAWSPYSVDVNEKGHCVMTYEVPSSAGPPKAELSEAYDLLKAKYYDGEILPAEAESGMESISMHSPFAHFLVVYQVQRVFDLRKVRFSTTIPGPDAHTVSQEDPDGDPITPVELGIPVGMSPEMAAHLASERKAAERRVVLAAARAAGWDAGSAETPPTLVPGQVLEATSKLGGGDLYRIDGKEFTRVEIRASTAKGYLVLTFYRPNGREFGHEDPAPSVSGWANAHKEAGLIFVGVIGAEPGTKYTLEFKQSEQAEDF